MMRILLALCFISSFTVLIMEIITGEPAWFVSRWTAYVTSMILFITWFLEAS